MTKLLKKKVNKFLKILRLDKDVIELNKPYDIINDYKQNKVWGSVDNSGVYIFYSSSGDLLYIGETINIGGRMSHYFKYAKDRSGKSISNKSKNVRWVVIIGFINKYWFLAPALEHFLIKELKPKRNINIK